MREVAIYPVDFELFDQDVSPADYEFFKKHVGAFKRMLEDQPRERKKKCVVEFAKFSIDHGCMKGFPTKSENFYGYLDEASAYYEVNFVDGKYSNARHVVEDAVILAQNRHNLQYMGASSYAKDPFFYKETRDVFRRLFGHPSEKGTCLKVVCVLPLHIKFGGTMCRYLRRWLEAEDVQMPVRQPLTNASDQSSEKTKQTTSQKSTSTNQKTTEKSNTKKKDSKPDDKKVVKTDSKGAKPQDKVSKSQDITKSKGREKKDEGFDFKDILPSPEPLSSMQFNFNTSSFLYSKSGQIGGIEETNSDRSLSLAEYLLGGGKMDTKSSLDKAPVGIDTSDAPMKVDQSKRFPFEFPEFKITPDTKPEDIATYVMDNCRRYANCGKPPRSEEEKWRQILLEHRPGEDTLEKRGIFNSVENDDDSKDVRDMFPELQLGKPHPNKVFDEMEAKRNENGEKHEISAARRQELAAMMNRLQDSTNHEEFAPITKETPKKAHACANCRRVEPTPNTFKKCQRCKGKRTRFYCSRRCQAEDWVSRHRDEHITIETITS